MRDLKSLSSLVGVAQGNKGRAVLSVPLDEVISKEQVRKRFTKLDELANSLKTEGQQSPIIVSPKNTDGKYVIQKGERRWRASQLAGLATIDILVNDKTQNALEATAGELVENIQREDLTPMEIATGLKRFIEAGWKQKDIAERLGKNLSYISSHLSLLQLPECVANLYEQEISNDTETLNNLRLLHTLDPKQCEALCKKALGTGISRKQSRERLNEAKQLQKDKKVTPENTASNKTTALTTQTEPATSWRAINPGSLVITVEVRLDRDKGTQTGVLLNDRVSLEADKVWVRCGTDEPMQVSIEQIKLIAASD